MLEVLEREAIYLWYFFTIQFEQIFGYWLLGIVIGSAISVFGKQKIHDLFNLLQHKSLGAFGLLPASLLGIASPLCMYGTIPIAASFSEKGMRDDWLAAFMMSSVLLNPQLILYSAALGPTALGIRLISCFVCGVAAGLCVRAYCARGRASEPARTRVPEAGTEPAPAGGPLSGRAGPAGPGGQVRSFFNFSNLREPENRDTDPHPLIRLLKNIWRNVKITGPYFLLGIALAAVFQRYVPESVMVSLFGNDKAFGVLMAASIGVPIYACGGGTIPLLQQWLASGMSMGSAAAFMLTGPATKITNLGAVKIVLGMKNFAFYLLFVMAFAFLTGLLINLAL